MKISPHAIQRYSERTGADVLEAGFELRKLLEDTEPCTREYAEKLGFRLRANGVHRADTFRVWKCNRIGEYICAIEREGVLCTLLTQTMHSFRNHDRLSKRRLNM